jgi:hypothetical protein
VLPAVLAVWRPGLDVAADPWVAWARSGSDRPLQALRFLDRLIRGEPVGPSAPDVLASLAGVRSRTSAKITDATATAQRVRRAWREDQAEAAALVRAIIGDRVPEPLLVD